MSGCWGKGFVQGGADRPLPARGFLSSRGGGREVAMKCYNNNNIFHNSSLRHQRQSGGSVCQHKGGGAFPRGGFPRSSLKRLHSTVVFPGSPSKQGPSHSLASQSLIWSLLRSAENGDSRTTPICVCPPWGGGRGPGWLCNLPTQELWSLLSLFRQWGGSWASFFFF